MKLTYKKITEYWKISTTIEKIIISIYILSFSGATYNHIVAFIDHGIFPGKNVPLWVNIYWTSLTFADPLSILLLLLDKNKGLFLYGLVIISDVIVNTYVSIILFPDKNIFSFFWICQVSFMIFYIITFRKISIIGRVDRC